MYCLPRTRELDCGIGMDLSNQPIIGTCKEPKAWNTNRSAFAGAIRRINTDRWIEPNAAYDHGHVINWRSCGRQFDAAMPNSPKLAIGQPRSFGPKISSLQVEGTEDEFDLWNWSND